MLPLSGTVVGDGVVAGSRRPGRWHHFGRGRGEPEKGGPPACRPGPDGAAPVPHVPTEPAPGSGAPDAVPPPGDERAPGLGDLPGIPCTGGHDGSEGAPTCRDAKSPVFLTRSSTSCWRVPIRGRPSTRTASSTA